MLQCSVYIGHNEFHFCAFGMSGMIELRFYYLTNTFLELTDTTAASIIAIYGAHDTLHATTLAALLTVI